MNPEGTRKSQSIPQEKFPEKTGEHKTPSISAGHTIAVYRIHPAKESTTHVTITRTRYKSDDHNPTQYAHPHPTLHTNPLHNTPTKTTKKKKEKTRRTTHFWFLQTRINARLEVPQVAEHAFFEFLHVTNWAAECLREGGEG
jgi:hypothetical protein